MKPFVRELLITVAIAVVIFVAARQTIQTYEVFQMSMEPNFYEGQHVVVNKAVYFWSEPERGDVIIFDAPDSEDDYIKRIIGLPGDTVEIRNGLVFVNGTALVESYVAAAPIYTMAEITVPEGEYFVLGDNRNYSNDSHTGWRVSEDTIHGKAWLSTWPPDLWGVVPEYALGDQLVSADSGEE